MYDGESKREPAAFSNPNSVFDMNSSNILTKGGFKDETPFCL